MSKITNLRHERNVSQRHLIAHAILPGRARHHLLKRYTHVYTHIKESVMALCRAMSSLSLTFEPFCDPMLAPFEFVGAFAHRVQQHTQILYRLCVWSNDIDQLSYFCSVKTPCNSKFWIFRISIFFFFNSKQTFQLDLLAVKDFQVLFLQDILKLQLIDLHVCLFVFKNKRTEYFFFQLFFFTNSSSYQIACPSISKVGTSFEGFNFT